MRSLTGGADTVEVQAGTVEAILSELSAKYEGMDKRFYKAPGELNRFVNFYVNDEDIRFMDNLQTQVKEGDNFSIVPAVAGG
jgi:molybdopterin synthase sulfur carrier subunit